MGLQQLFAGIDARKEKLDEYRPLTQGEAERLRDEFIIGFTYNSNAIEGNTMTLDEAALQEGVTIDGKAVREHMELIGFRAWNSEKDSGLMAELVGEYMTARLDEYLQILEIANGQGQGPKMAME